MLDHIKLLNSMTSPLRSGWNCHQRSVLAYLILLIHVTPEYLCRPHRPLLKKLSPEGKMRPLRILTKLRNFTLLVLSELPALGCSVLVSTKRSINPSLNTLLSSARPNGNHLLLALMFLLLLVAVLYNLVLPRRLV